jgi:hypothetical protein
MPEFAIHRVQKLKSLAVLRQVAEHNYRLVDTPNADPERQANNQVLYGTTDVEADVKSKIEAAGLDPAKLRKSCTAPARSISDQTAKDTANMTRSALRNGRQRRLLISKNAGGPTGSPMQSSTSTKPRRTSKPSLSPWIPRQSGSPASIFRDRRRRGQGMGAASTSRGRSRRGR